MEEENIIIEKSLEDNYLKIQIKEIEVGEKSYVLVIDFSKNTADLISTFNAEQKEVNKQKIEINNKYKLLLDEIKEKHEKNIIEITSIKEVVEANSVKEIEAANALKTNEITKLNKSIDKIEKDYLKQVNSVLKEYENNIAKSEEEIIEINTKVDLEKENLAKKYEDEKAKHVENLADLNGDIAAKIKKFTNECNLKIEKADEEISNAEAKYKKDLAELKATCKIKTLDFETENTNELLHFNTKNEEITSVLESKVTRHEKFMNRSIENKDQRAAKQHKKEIVILQKNAEKELKTLTDAHNIHLKEYDVKRKALDKENLEVISDLTKKLINFRDEKQFEISTHKAVLNSGVESFKFDIDTKIQEEINKFNMFEKDNSIELSGIILKHEIDLEKEQENQAKLKIDFDKDNSYNKVKKEEELAMKDKELKVIESNFESTLALIELNKSIELRKIDYDIEVAKKTYEYDLKLNDEKENIEFNDLDLIVSGEIRKGKSPLQNDINVLFGSRENFILAFEEEVNSKISQNILPLETKKAKIESDKNLFIAKINTVFDADQALFEEKKSNANEEDLEDLELYGRELIERKKLSIEHVEDFFNKELAKLNDNKQRILRIFESSSIILQSAQLRNSRIVDTTTKTENDVTKEYNISFEKEISAIKAVFDKDLLELNKKIKTETANYEKIVSQEESELARRVVTFNKEIKDIENLKLKDLKTDELLRKENYSNIRNKENIEIKTANNEYSQKENVYKQNISKIDKVSGVIHKNLEATKKVLEKEYNLDLTKKLKDVNLKLQQDIKNIQ